MSQAVPRRADERSPRRRGRSAAKFKYQLLARQLADEIRAHYRPGDRFDSEPDLCLRLDAARTTVRKAIDLLADQAMLERRGRAGNFVADYRQTTWDDRLLCVAMPIRNHLWDQLFLSLSHQSIAHERFALICDFTGVNVSNPFAEVLPVEQRLERLQQTLSFRPRTLVLFEPGILASLGSLREEFRNLIVLSGQHPAGFDHAARVGSDSLAPWFCAGRHARRAGYTRVIVFVPPGSTNLALLQQGLTTADGGAFPMEQQMICFEHHAAWPEQLREAARRDDGPLAILCSYDWGAHLALQVVRETGCAVPTAVGIYGMNNTPWSIQDNLTSVHADPDRWAEAIFRADEALDQGETNLVYSVAPTVVERGSTNRAAGMPS